MPSHSISSRRWPAAFALVALMGVTSCSVSSDSDDASSSTTTSAEPTETTVAKPVRGVTEDTIKIGTAFIDTDAVREQFAIELGRTPPEVLPAIIESINADGGIHGRSIELVERLVLPVGNESSDQACRELVEDEEVFAVVGTFLGDTALCVTETYETPYFGGFGLTPERQERSAAPFITTAANEADSISESMELLLAEGVLEGAKVAVYSETGGYTPEFMDENVFSILEEGDVDVVSRAELSDTAGDLVASGNELDRILQRFEADGADTLLAVSGLPVLVPALERTDYAPQLIVANGQIIGREAPASFGLTNPAELAGALGVTPGVLPEEMEDDPAFLDCIAGINEHTDLDITPSDIFPVAVRPESRDFRNVPILCDVFTLLEAVLTAAGENLSSETMLEGLDELDSFPLIGNPDASLSSDRWGAGTAARLWEFDEDEVWFQPVDS